MQTPFRDAELFFSELYHGVHHIPGKIKAFGQGWSVNHYGELSTFDFDTMTRLVFMAHDRCMRASVMQSGPNMVKIVVWQREGRIGSFCCRHPTIEEALEIWREKHFKQEDENAQR